MGRIKRSGGLSSEIARRRTTGRSGTRRSGPEGTTRPQSLRVGCSPDLAIFSTQLTERSQSGYFAILASEPPSSWRSHQIALAREVALDGPSVKSRAEAIRVVAWHPQQDDVELLWRIADDAEGRTKRERTPAFIALVALAARGGMPVSTVESIRQLLRTHAQRFLDTKDTGQAHGLGYAAGILLPWLHAPPRLIDHLVQLNFNSTALVWGPEEYEKQRNWALVKLKEMAIESGSSKAIYDIEYLKNQDIPLLVDAKAATLAHFGADGRFNGHGLVLAVLDLIDACHESAHAQQRANEPRADEVFQLLARDSHSWADWVLFKLLMEADAYAHQLAIQREAGLLPNIIGDRRLGQRFLQRFRESGEDGARALYLEEFLKYDHLGYRTLNQQEWLLAAGIPRLERLRAS